MTAQHRPAASGADTTIVRAGPADIDVLSQVIAEAFFDLAVSQWLVPDPHARRAILPEYFGMYVEQTLSDGLVVTTPARDAAALWRPVAADGPAPPAEEYHHRLAALTGPHLARFEALDEAFDRHHPIGVTHEHLMILAVRPERQRLGIGTALLNARHAVLDRDWIPAYLEASDLAKRDIYRTRGYADYGTPIQLPDGPSLYPMWRHPHRNAETAQWGI